MNFYIFTDIDGTLLNHHDYSYGYLKSFISRIKNDVSIIFNSSKTFREITYINNKLDLNFPFIVENGACIFFPKKNSLIKKPKDSFFKYENYLGYKLTNLTTKLVKDKLSILQKKYNFSFYSDLDDYQIYKITNLTKSSLFRSKQRLFTNPIHWNDSDEKFEKFKVDVFSLDEDLKIYKGGRFIHISDYYDKGIALSEFLMIYNLSENLKYKTISLGDSDNDVPMLELTDYSCIIKSKKIEIPLKKNNNIYYSNDIAPVGWQESLEFVFKKENKNF